MTAFSYVPRWWRRVNRSRKRLLKEREQEEWRSCHYPAGYSPLPGGEAVCMWCDHFAPYDRERATSIETWGQCARHRKSVPEFGFCPDWRDTPVATENR
jgi:hypothetical protein